ncbi:MAG: SDR family oxidoreductase [Bacteroidota bacterium]
MTVLVAGAHGAVGQHIVRQLSQAGHRVRAMIRDAAQSDLMRTLGAAPLVADLTGDVSGAPEGCDAVIFAAGSGGNDVEGVDRDGAIKLIDATAAHGIDRFVMLSSIGADAPEEADQLQDYLRAKHEADEHLKGTSLAYTILRPTTLTNGAQTRTAHFARSLDRDAVPMKVAREDVAEALVAALTVSETEGATVEMTAGETPIREGLAGQ